VRPELSKVRFGTLCNRNPVIFGEPGSALRRQVQNRLQFLKLLRKTKRSRFLELCYEKGVDVSASLPEPIDGNEDDDDDDDEDSNKDNDNDNDNKANDNGDNNNAHNFHVDTVLPRRSLLKYTKPNMSKPSRNSLTPTKCKCVISVRYFGAFITHYVFDFLAIVECQTEEFILDIENPERNPMDIWVSHGEKIKQGKFIVDALTIYKHIADVRDAETAALYDAHLVDDGRALSVTMPSVPAYFLKNMPSMKHNESSDAIEEIFLDHSIKLTAVLSDRARQKKIVKMYFPDGMQCSSEFFNGATKKATNKVQKNIRMVKIRTYKNSTGDEVPVLASYVSWTVAIDGSLRMTSADDSDDEDNMVMDALKRMEI
jgi:hypothetical protein